MIAGLYTIYGGLIVALVGLVCLGVYVFDRPQVKHRWRKAALAGGLILLNGPACVAIILGVWSIETRYVVTVVNESDVVVESLVLTGPGVERSWTAIRPGERKRTGFHIAGPGSLSYQGVAVGREFEGIVDPYVTSGVGGEAQLHFTAEREFIVEFGSEIPSKHGI